MRNTTPKDSWAAAHVRAGRTNIRRVAAVGPCYRCGTKDCPLYEIGEPPMQVRLCPPCAKALEARPYRAYAAQGHAHRIETNPEPDWESAETSPGKRPLQGWEFRNLAERLVGKDRARAALDDDCEGE